MKTSEMIAMLEKRKGLKFKNIRTGWLYGFYKNDDKPKENSKFRNRQFVDTPWAITEDNIFDEWELVKPEPKEVPFMEAINSGKRIKPKIEIHQVDKEFYEPYRWLGTWSITIEQANGKWLIEEPDNE